MLRGKEGESLWQGLERVDNYVDELQQTSEQILELSRMDRDTLSVYPVSLNEILAQCGADYETTPALAIRLPEQDILTPGDSGLLRRVLGNLLDNAVQYHQSYIQASLTLTEQRAVICVENDGADLTPDDLAQLFQPFYRADSSRSRRSGGLGID
ncbi:sensor histidine kinase [Aliamphritea spongicola]